MSTVELTFFQYWLLAIEAIAYVAFCAILLRVLWLIVTVGVDKPRPMWEKK